MGTDRKQNERGKAWAIMLAIALCALAGGLLASMPGPRPDQAHAGTLATAATAKKYPIVYKLDGGKQAKGQVLKIASGKTMQVASLKKPKRPGYTFAGWYKNKARTKKATVLKGARSEAKRRVYAKWKAKTYSLSYKVNGGKLKGSYAKTYKTGHAVKLPTPVKARYTFGGWFSNKKLTKAVGTTTKKLIGNKKLYAKWNPIEYSIAYVLDGGRLPDGAPTTYSVKSPVETLPTPVREGYSFIGWYSDAGRTEHVTSLPATSKGNKRLYALWRKRVLVAHRGFRANAPENSVKAIEDAAAKGFREVEFDVRFSSDGVPVLAHDDTIPVVVPTDTGTTTSATPVSSLPYEELQGIAMAKAQSGTGGNNLATFEEAIAACKACGVMATIHMKSSAVSEVDTLVDIAAAYGMQDEVHWLTGDLTALQYIRALDPDAAVMYFHGITEQAVADAMEFADGGDVMISASYKTMTEKKIALCKQAGLPIDLWTLPDETYVSQWDTFISTIVIDDVKAARVPDIVA